MASAVHNALRQFGQVLGVAVLGAIIDARAAAGGPAGFVTGLHEAMRVSGTVLLGTAVLTAALLHRGVTMGNDSEISGPDHGSFGQIKPMSR